MNRGKDIAMRAHTGGILKITAWALAVLICLALCAVFWMSTLRATPDHDYRADLLASIESKQPEGENGWDAIGAAEKLYNRWDELTFCWSDVPVAPRAAEFSDLREFLEQVRYEEVIVRSGFNNVGSYDEDGARLSILRQSFNAIEKYGMTDRLRRLRSHDRFVPSIKTGQDYAADDPARVMFAVLFPEFGWCRALFGIELCRLRFAAIDGSSDGVVDGFRGALVCARASEAYGSLIAMLVDFSIRSAAYNELQLLLTEQKPAVINAAPRLLAELDQLGHVYDLTTITRHEQLGTLDFIQWEFTGEPGKSGHAIRRIGDTGFVFPMFWHPSRIQHEQRMEQTIAWTEPAVHIPPCKRKRGSDHGVVPIGPTPIYDMWSEERWATYVDIWQADLCRENATRIMLSLEIFRKQHGDYPDSLTELAPGILDNLPPDPFAPDSAYRYIRIDPRFDQLRREYLLYTVGVDGDDDFAIEPDDWHALAYPSSMSIPDGDYVFNRPRETIEQSFAK